MRAAIWAEAVKLAGSTVGRVASIIGPLAAGWVISLGWSSRATFLVAVIPALCASAAVLRLHSRAPQIGVCDVGV